jgi:hypothetical protein
VGDPPQADPLCVWRRLDRTGSASREKEVSCSQGEGADGRRQREEHQQ